MTKNFFLLLVMIAFIKTAVTQNVGIGTTDPQRKLHVAGGLRLDTLVSAGNAPGLLQSNSSGDVSNLFFTGNNNQVLKADGTWGTANGTIPASGIIASRLYNNTALINAGYSLIGEIPGAAGYTTTNATFPANSWQPAYTRGIVANVSAPVFTSNGGEPTIAFWNGSLLYVSTSSNMYTYNPVTDTWSIVGNHGFINYLGSKGIWTGTEFIFWSNYSSIFGERYNPSTNIWTIMSTTNAPSPRYDYSMIWDGTEVIVWGGTNGGTLNTGAMYNPVTNVWTTMNTASAPAARQKHTAIWNTATNRMIIWGGSSASFSGEMNSGGLFDPVTNGWTGVTNTATAPSARNLQSAVWSGTEMIIFGGNFSSAPINTGGKYNPSTDTWVATSTSGPSARFSHSSIWAGSLMYVTGGRTGSSSFNDGYSYNPSTNTWTSLGQFSATDSKMQHNSFFTGNMLVIWGGISYISSSIASTWSNTGYRYFLNSTASSATTLTSETLYLYIKN